MDPITVGVVCSIVLVALFFIGIPIAYCLGIVGLSGLAALFGFDAAIGFSMRKIHDYVAHFTFTSIPLFILMGYLALYSEMTDDAFAAARVWLSKVHGGLASAVVVASGLFAACSGSGLPAAAALGRIAVPEMIKRGYDRGLATGVVAASTPLAVLIPPSVTMIIYGILTETSIAHLLIAGILPGIVACIVFILGITIRVWHNPKLAPAIPGVITWRERFRELFKIWGIVFLFVFVIGSMYFGWTTPTEAAGFGAFGTLVLGLVRKRLSWSEIKKAVYESVYVSAILLVIIAMAAIFNVFLVRSGVVDVLAENLIALNPTPLTMLFMMSIFYIILGCFLDSISMMIITIPIFLPLLKALDIDLIWFGIIVTIWIEIAAITPPFGISVYALKGALGDSVDLWEIFRGCFFFFWLWFLVLVIIIAFPQVSLWLPAFVRN
jgi:tripartite ATP-independent transporter DctM subunit